MHIKTKRFFSVPIGLWYSTVSTGAQVITGIWPKVYFLFEKRERMYVLVRSDISITPPEFLISPHVSD